MMIPLLCIHDIITHVELPDLAIKDRQSQFTSRNQLPSPQVNCMVLTDRR